ncbi:MAG TPA: LPS assembly lipoprotein LptE [Thermoanaerobaculia bacterium]|nr:LPS assembly lipoprotein LptE [Thermoanaerobaculia bacterium]
MGLKTLAALGRVASGRQPGQSTVLGPLSSVGSLILLALIACSCGYGLAGRTSTLPPSIKIIQFSTLVNQTSLAGVEQRVSGEIAKELAARGHFRVQAEAAGADAQLSGAVTRFDFYPVAFDSSGRATQYQVAVTARVALKSLPEGTPVWENPAYTFRENYSFEGAGSTVDRQNETIDKVAEKFAEALVSSLLEGF